MGRRLEWVIDGSWTEDNSRGRSSLAVCVLIAARSNGHRSAGPPRPYVVTVFPRGSRPSFMPYCKKCDEWVYPRCRDVWICGKIGVRVELRGGISPLCPAVLIIVHQWVNSSGRHIGVVVQIVLAIEVGIRIPTLVSAVQEIVEIRVYPRGQNVGILAEIEFRVEALCIGGSDDSISLGALSRSIDKVLIKGVLTRCRDVGIVRQIKVRTEVGRRVPALFKTIQLVMRERIDTGLSDVRVGQEIKVGRKVGVRIPAFRPTVRNIVLIRINFRLLSHLDLLRDNIRGRTLDAGSRRTRWRSRYAPDSDCHRPRGPRY